MIKSFKFLLCIVLSVLILFTGCSINESQSSQSQTETATSANLNAISTTSVATDDTAKNTHEYNYVSIKQNTDEITAQFDKLIIDENYFGTTYMRVGNDFEYLKSSGYANKSEHISNSINTCYYTGSITKQITAAAVMLLCEQGKLSVDDTIEKYFPSYEYADEITIKNLLTMTSGIKNYVNRYNETENFIYVQSDLEDEISEDNSAVENKKIILDWILKQELVFEPDSKYSFSDSNYYLLGEIIEKAGGKSYESFVTDNITKPLGLTCSGFKGSENLSVSYEGNSQSKSALYPGVGYSSTGFISNISDVLKWVDGLLDGQILSMESVDEMFTPYKENFAYGVFVNDNRISITGKTESYNAMLVYKRDKSEIYVSLSNHAFSDPVYIYSLFKNYLSRFYL